MYCQKCGKENEEGNSFCAACGASLNSGVKTEEKKKDLDIVSFLSSSTEYQKKKKILTTIPGICMTIFGFAAVIFIMYGTTSFSSTAMGLALACFIIAFIVFLPIIIVGGLRLDKYGNRLYREYLDKQ